MTYSSNNLPKGLTIDVSTGIINGVPTEIENINSIITVNNEISEKQFEINFNIVNIYKSKYIFSTSDIIINPEILLTGNYSAINLPTELTINSKTGIITGHINKIKQYITVIYNDEITITFKIIAPAFKSCLQNNVHITK